MKSGTTRNSVVDFSNPAHSAHSNLALDNLLEYQSQSIRTTDDLPGGIHDEDRSSGLREFSLPPVDKGKDAWLCLAGGFFLELMVWGIYHPEDSLSMS